jgi:Ni/Co efflux regulator RcnB
MIFRKISPLVVLLASLAIAPASVLADKGGRPANGREKGNKHEQTYDDRREASPSVSVEFHFGDQDRRVVSDYYGEQAKAGRCPPGLAKKGNGCVPPGQARKWARGRPLPADVVFYELPRDLVVRLPPPPEGHRYVRVAGDVLLIAIGTSIVVDAVQDILR